MKRLKDIFNTEGMSSHNVVTYYLFIIASICLIPIGIKEKEPFCFLLSVIMFLYTLTIPNRERKQRELSKKYEEQQRLNDTSPMLICMKCHTTYRCTLKEIPTVCECGGQLKRMLVTAGIWRQFSEEQKEDYKKNIY